MRSNNRRPTRDTGEARMQPAKESDEILKKLIGIFALVALAVTVAACGSGRSGSTENTVPVSVDTSISGAIVIDGSSTLAPLATAVAERFQASAPNVTVTVGTSGTGGGFEKFCNGETDITTASRAIEPDEEAACAANGITYKTLPVANDGIAVVSNKANTWATCLTTDQLAAIWGPTAAAKTWQDIDPAWPAETLKLYGPGPDSGTFDFFTKVINGEEGASRTDYAPSEDDNVTIQGVSGEKGGLGYFGLSYYEQNTDRLNLVQIDSGGGCIAPDAKTVRDGTYTPLSRALYMYISDAALERPEVKAMVGFYVANETSLTESVLFVPLNPDQLEEAEALVDLVTS